MTVTTTSHGALVGDDLGDVVAFRGVPYAAPPVGERRWRPAEPPEPWTGERDATRYGPVPPQDMGADRLARWGLTMGEDCLALNVWTPAADDGRRPVLVFLHGGGVATGTAAAPLLDGARLAARGDAVVVTVGFRLGALGQLHAPAQLGAGTTNLAFRDQLAALRWVRDEIGAFGGDPACVTVVGQSSGAVAVACMLAGTAAARDGTRLFDRAILQSGGLERVRSPEAATDVARQFFTNLVGEPEPADFDPRSPTVEEILAAQLPIPTGFVPPEGPFHHHVDGDVIPEHPLVTAQRRPLLDVPVLAGTTAHEWRVFDTVLADEEVTIDFVRHRARVLAGEDVDIDDVLARYGSTDDVRSRRELASALVTDYHFAAPTEQLLRAHAGHGRPAFRYELQWPSPRPGIGSGHDTCLPLLFGTMDRAKALAGEGPEVTQMSETLQDAWLAFARTGDPSTPWLGEWPDYDPDRRSTMLLGATSRVEDHWRHDQLAVWDDRYPARP